MRIVFEVAACSWKDDLEDSEICETSTEQNFDVSNKFEESIADEEALLLRSMMLRIQYGGMKW